VKLTQLGFDLEPDATMLHMERLADRSADMGRTVWIDMEASAYVDGTIDLYTSLLKRSPNSGLCLQAYLRRTWDDVQKLAPMSPSIRLVKGAYRESKDVAFQDKRLIDESFFRLASHLATSARRLALGTHDTDLVERIEATVPRGRDAFEVAMLYGIRSDEQHRLAREGYSVRTLIAYGPYWYPWFMRRIAEKPIANILLALRNVL
jgi:proline dehydrogenase